MANPRGRKFSLGDVIRKLNEAGDSVLPILDTPEAAEQSDAATLAPEPAPAPSSTPTERPRYGQAPPRASQSSVPPPRRATPPPSSTPKADDSEGEEEFDVWRYLAVIARRRAVVIAAMAVAGLYSVFAYVVAPRYYVAHARLLFSPGYQEIVDNYPSMYHAWMNDERQFSTHLELLRSRAVLELLAQNLNGRISAGEIAAGLTIKRGETDGQENDIFEISFQHRDGELARDVANELCRTYIDYRREVNAQEQTRLIVKLEGQIDKLAGDLNAKEDAFRVFKENNRMVQLSDETNAVVSQVTSMAAALQQTQLELAETKERLAALRSSISQQEVDVVESMTYDNAYQSRLADLELQLSTLSAEYSPEHFKVRMIREQIDTLQKSMASDVRSRVARQTTFVKNPVREGLIKDLVELTINNTALEKKQSAQGGLIEHLNQRLAGLPSVEQQYVALDREKSLLDETLKLLKREYEQAKIKRDSQESDLRVFELAQTPGARLSDAKLLNILIGLAVGLLLGIGLAFGLEYLDQTVKSPADVEKLLDAPMLGFVPLIEAENAMMGDPKDLAKTIIEPFRAVRANLKHLTQQQGLRTLMVCSAVKGEGKTTLAANLAVTFALDGRSVILVDGDLRRPQIHRLFNLAKETGVADYLHDDCEVDGLLKKTGYAGLSVITAGATPHHPAELLGSPRFAKLVAELRNRCDLVLFDSPALLPVSDVITMAPHMDSAVMVVRTLWTPAKAARHAIDQIRRIGTPIVGGIVNGVSHSRSYYPYYYGYYGYYAYRYGYGDGDSAGGSRGWVREFGVRAEAVLKEQIQNMRYAAPRMTLATSAFLRSLARRPLFWILLVTLLAFMAAQRKLGSNAKDDSARGILLVDSVSAGAGPASAPEEQSVAQARTAAMIGAPLGRCLDAWRQALVQHDTIDLLGFYRVNEIQWEMSDGHQLWGSDALRCVLSLVSVDSILRMSAACGDSSRDTCTVTTLVKRTPADSSRAELTSRWRRESGTWRAVFHAWREGVNQ